MNKNLTKKCIKCHKTKPLDEFYNRKSAKDGKRGECKKCESERSKKYKQKHHEELTDYNRKYSQEHKEEINKRRRNYSREQREKLNKRRKIYYEKTGRQKRGCKSMYENKLCASYLGIVIAERLVRHLFKDVEVMPHGNPKFDFICNKGKKIDVKSGCITLDHGKHPRWSFNIEYNKIPDFFILVAFDNRTDLNPLHLWMIPGRKINNNSGKSIRPSTVHKWSQWERSIEEVQMCCTLMKI